VFKKKKDLDSLSVIVPNKPVIYPKWSFVKTENNFWLVLDKTKMQLISERAFLSWGKPYLYGTDKSLSNYKIWKKVGFAPGTLVRCMDGKFWFITGSHPLETERRLVSTPDFFTILGFNPNNAILISQDELLFHEEGMSINGI
jgi:hypothetical protein